jgi:hypothetical protein
MLAQSFKPALELGISDEQHQGLIDTMNLLETTGSPFRFDMNNWFNAPVFYYTCPSNMHARYLAGTHDCGTAACIGGTAEAISGVSFKGQRTPQLYNLFFPYSVRVWARITEQMGGQAIRNYLTTGYANWPSIVPSENLIPEIVEQEKHNQFVR